MSLSNQARRIMSHEHGFQELGRMDLQTGSDRTACTLFRQVRGKDSGPNGCHER